MSKHDVYSLDGERLLDKVDIARLAGRTVQTIFNWRNRGLLPAPVAAPGREMYREPDVLRMLGHAPAKPERELSIEPALEAIERDPIREQRDLTTVLALAARYPG